MKRVKQISVDIMVDGNVVENQKKLLTTNKRYDSIVVEREVNINENFKTRNFKT